MKGVLLVSYHFPPDATVGSLRCQKFAKYLPAHGWTPYVLTVKERHYQLLDPTRLSEVAGVRITRTKRLPSPLSALLTVRTALLRAIGRSDAANRRRESDPHMTVDSPEESGPETRSRIRRLILSLGRLPDDHVGWFPLALTAGLRICRRHDIQAIVSTSPPHTAHLVGLALNRLTGIRWVADFRDPWIGNPAKHLDHRTDLSDRIDSMLERAVVRKADRILVLTERLRAALLGRYPEESSGKFSTIPNGFDPDDFAAVGMVAPNPYFTIVHTGTLYYRRSPRGLLAAIASLLRQGKVPRSDVRLVFVGTNSRGHRPDVLGEALGLTDVIQVLGLVSHHEALSWMRRADVLCLFAQHQAEQIPAKAFEYLATGATVLAVTSDGATADLITKAGGVVVPDEPWAIEEAVHQQYLRYRAGVRPASMASPWTREEVRSFDRRVLTGRLAALLGGRA